MYRDSQQAAPGDDILVTVQHGYAEWRFLESIRVRRLQCKDETSAPSPMVHATPSVIQPKVAASTHKRV
jgi:hypothetical protein